MTRDRFDAIVLAGGASRRFGGADKAMMRVGEVTLLQRAVDAVADAAITVVAGPRRRLDSHVIWVQEHPPGAGPAHALGAAIASVSAEVVVVLACDLPFASRPVVCRLVDAVGNSDGAVLRDGLLRPQPLFAAYRTAALRHRLTAVASPDSSMREVVSGIEVEFVADAIAAFDCDTPDDLDAARTALNGSVKVDGPPRDRRPGE
jgi:molybdopterin-guanine dinucleotide biosynthesis protein A